MDPLERLFRHLVRTIEASFPAYLSRPFEVGELYQTILPYRHHRRELGLETNQDYEMAITQLLAGYGGYLIVDDQMRERLQRELASANPDPGAFREFAGSQVALSPEAVRRVRGGGAEEPRPSFVAPSPVSTTAVGTAQPAAAPAATRQSAAAATTTAFSAARASSAGSAGGGSAAGGGAGGGGAAGPSRAATDASPPARPSAASARTATPATPTGTVRHATPITVATGQSCRYCGGALPSGRRIVFCPHCGQDLTTVNCQACGTELELGWKFCTSCGRPVGSANG